jgi:excisionase family DNA binding protein
MTTQNEPHHTPTDDPLAAAWDEISRNLDKPKPERLLTIKETANWVRVHPGTIRRWIKDGSLPAIRVGKRNIAIRRQAVLDLLRPSGST